MFFGILAILILFIVPICLSGYNKRISAETQANEIIEEFIDNCRASAYFTENDYNNLYKHLEDLGCRWNIDVYHYSKQYASDGMFEEIHDSNDIGEYFYTNGIGNVARYNMKLGDKIEVRAVSKSEFMGVNLVKIFVPMESRIFIDMSEKIDNNID